MPAIRDEVLRRLVVSKQLLLSKGGQLTPSSDAVAVAHMILTAHDSAELAAAAIARHVGVTSLTDKTYLLDYPALIEKTCARSEPFPGKDFVRQLNKARIFFKHDGILPDPRDWYRVIENTWGWIDKWCSTYVGISFDEIDLEQLLEDKEVRALYQAAKAEKESGHLQAALELLGLALYLVLDRFPGIWFPSIGQQSTEHALLLSAFGIRPGDFLNLQQLLPRVTKVRKTGEFSVEWDRRGTGNPANWTRENVRFCLETLIDIALKIQHAPAPPTPMEFSWVFDDIISPKGDFVDLWQYEYREEGFARFFERPVGKKVVLRLNKGEKLRCFLSPARSQEEETTPDPASFLRPKETIETADLISIMSDEIEGRFALVERKDIDISFDPKEEDWVRERFPHLFEGG
jgi:hypothetical protein